MFCLQKMIASKKIQQSHVLQVVDKKIRQAKCDELKIALAFQVEVQQMEKEGKGEYYATQKEMERFGNKANSRQRSDSTKFDDSCDDTHVGS